MSQESFEGGCHCGAIRYRITASPIDTGYCHCLDCQKTSGAPVLAWAVFPMADTEVIGGPPKVYESSHHGRRHFCPACGSQLFFTHEDAKDMISLNIGGLDDATKIAPRVHIWTDRQIPWFQLDDDLPRHGKDEPEST